MSLNSFIIFLIYFLGLTLALNPTLQKKSFFVSPNNHLSYDLHLTPNGIIAHSIEPVNKTTYVSQYLLIDVSSKEAKPILTDLIQLCEPNPPIFQALHYHIETNSLIYYCLAENSLVVINQSDYTVQATIPFNLSGASWPIAKLSPEGVNVAVLLMDQPFITTPKNSRLVKVDMQTKQVISYTVLGQGLAEGEAIVAFASNKNLTYLASNRIDGKSLFTTVYLFENVKLTPITNFSISITTEKKTVTQLFLVGDLIAINNGDELYFVNQLNISRSLSPLSSKLIFNDGPRGLSRLAISSQNGRNYFYIQTNYEGVYKWTVTGNISSFQFIGDFRDIQVAYGDGDLLFGLDRYRDFFNIIDLQNLQKIYRVVSTSQDLIFTNATYASVQFNPNSRYDLYILDLNETLIQTINIPYSYYHNQEQQIISFFEASSLSTYALTHIDLVTAKVWTTLNISIDNTLLTGPILALRITQHGNPEFVIKGSHGYIFYTELYGILNLPTNPGETDLFLNIDLDSLSFYSLNSDQLNNQINITGYAFDPNHHKFRIFGSNSLRNVSPAFDFFFVDSSTTLALAPGSLTWINGLGYRLPPVTDSFSANWNSASAFQDSDNNRHVILSKAGLFLERGSSPSLFSPASGFSPLPGVRKETIRAQAAGKNYYSVTDAFGSSVGFVRVYNAGSSEGNTLISM